MYVFHIYGRLCQTENRFVDFREPWYDSYTTGYNLNSCFSIFLRLVVKHIEARTSVVVKKLGLLNTVSR